MSKSSRKQKKTVIKNEGSKSPALKPVPAGTDEAKPLETPPAAIAVKFETPKPQPVVVRSSRIGACSCEAEAAKSETSEPKAAPGRVCLELIRPEAKEVYVAGSFNDWKPEQTPLRSLGNGRWVGDLAVKPGRHEYLFVVDGEWVADPNAKETVGNPFGGQNCVLTVNE